MQDESAQPLPPPLNPHWLPEASKKMSCSNVLQLFLETSEVSPPPSCTLAHCVPINVECIDSLQRPDFCSHSLLSLPQPHPGHIPSCRPTSSMKPALSVQFFPLLAQAWVDNVTITNSCLSVPKRRAQSLSGCDGKFHLPRVLRARMG